VLKKAESLLAYHGQAALQGLKVLSRKPLATLITTIVIAIALALPALFWVFTDNMKQLTKDWQKGGIISLYLSPSLTDSEQLQILEQVQHAEGVGQATLKSSTQGLADLTQQEGMEDIMHYLPENPLPAVIEIIPALSSNSPAKIDLLARQLQVIPHVDEAKVDMEWITRLHAVLSFSSNAADALLVLLALAVLLIIGNTLGLAIQNRQEEIQILKLIGATDPFIIRPFLYSGIFYGMAGAILAVVFVNMVILSMEMAVNHLIVAYQMHYPLNGMSIRHVLLLILFAIIIGWLGARLSVKRQLSYIEPYS
jgi:cell division transport system permease protein